MPKKLNQTYLNGNLVYFLRKLEGGTEALTVMMMLVRFNPHKRICFKGQKTKEMKKKADEIGISTGTLNKGLKLLKAHKLITYTATGIRILSNEQIAKKYGECKPFYAPYMDYSHLKYFIKNAEVLSNISQQKEAIAKKQHINTILSKKRPSIKEVKTVRAWCKNRGIVFTGDFKKLKKELNFNKDIILSRKKHGELLGGRSIVTAMRHSRKMAQGDKRLSFHRSRSKPIKNTITGHHEMISNGTLPPYAKFRFGQSYYDKATVVKMKTGFEGPPKKYKKPGEPILRTYPYVMKGEVLEIVSKWFKQVYPMHKPKWMQ